MNPILLLVALANVLASQAALDHAVQTAGRLAIAFSDALAPADGQTETASMPEVRPEEGDQALVWIPLGD